MTPVRRIPSTARLTRIVLRNGVVHVAGSAASDRGDRDGDAQAQTREILEKIDEYLVSVGTSKSRLLSAQVWLRDIDRDFAGMHAAWEAWAASGAVSTRATCEARLPAPGIRMEISVSAAL